MQPDLIDSEGAQKFALSFVDMIMTWNAVEGEARNLLLSTSKGGLGTFAAVLSLGNVALSNAILAEAEYMDQPDKEHLEHFAECMDRQRIYRNYYVHNLSVLGRTADGKQAGALLTGTEAKPYLRQTQASLSDKRVREFAEELEQLRLYGFRLNQMLRHKFKKLASLAESPPPTWPEKPPLPERLRKPRQHLPGLPLPPQS